MGNEGSFFFKLTLRDLILNIVPMTQSADGENGKVVMHNSLVRQVTHGLAKLGAMEHKIISMAVSQIDHRGDTIPDIEISVNELAQSAGAKGRSIYQETRTAARNLRTEEVIFIDPSTGDEVICGWLSVARYQKGGTLLCKFADDLKPVLVALKECRTEMELASIMQIGGSAYAHRLYQIACSWRSNHGWTSRLDVLRDQLGVQEGSYPTLKDFKRRCLDYPIAIINEKTDIKIAYEKGNKGHIWERVKFTVLSQSSKPEIKHVEKIPEHEEWFLKQIETPEGMQKIWDAALRLELVQCKNPPHVMTPNHGLAASAKSIYKEHHEPRLFDD
jgi:plasmid replication initiation protein